MASELWLIRVKWLRGHFTCLGGQLAGTNEFLEPKKLPDHVKDFMGLKPLNPNKFDPEAPGSLREMKESPFVKTVATLTEFHQLTVEIPVDP
jgi:hypothetical protein